MHERGLSVPDDLSVTGLDDTPEAAYFTPALTTTRLDFRQQVRDAVGGLLAKLGVSATIDVQCETGEVGSLVVRDSTGPARRIA